ncbi:hypothetical protein BDM02DRAFT_3271080 [Thelephora ganbajun]|uniref:Uncharacterized protein n=1 Tax=Thelephora ganbajun TaxID=370292 RepID=A0ACB6Z9U1_THEGA|nr:hypothetical protein BDM02DRAFT_3271080 [Thelephora ganbajun]
MSTPKSTPHSVKHACWIIRYPSQRTTKGSQRIFTSSAPYFHPPPMSPSAASPRLPQELVDSIIDELKNDVGSLRTCSLVSKPWVYRSRKYLFETVHLPTCLLRRWLKRIPVVPITPLGPHHHIRSLSLQPTAASAPFCVPEAFVDHLSSFTQVSKLFIASTLWEEWTDAFSDNALVAKYFGGFGQTLRRLELTRVYLNMVTLKALLDVFPQLESILIFSPTMVDEEVKSVEAFPHLREHRRIAEVESSSVTVPYKRAPIRLVDSITLLFPPKELVVGLANLPLQCRKLVLVEDSDYGGDAFNLLLDCTGPTLESLIIRNTFDRGLTVTLENCPVLCRLKTKAPYHGMLAYIDDQARLIQTVTSPFLSQIVFSGKWDDSQMGRATDWLEPVKWEMVDRELCNLMDRLDEEVEFEVVFADATSLGEDEFEDICCEQADSARAMLLNGVRTRGGVVKIQRTELK